MTKERTAVCAVSANLAKRVLGAWAAVVAHTIRAIVWLADALIGAEFRRRRWWR